MRDILAEIIDNIIKAANPDKIILFGSRSNGKEESDSDYDLLIIKDGVNNRRQMARHIYRNLVDIPVSIDILVETPEHIEKHKSTPGYILSEALKGQIIYER